MEQIKVLWQGKVNQFPNRIYTIASITHSKIVELKSSLLKMHCMLAYHR